MDEHLERELKFDVPEGWQLPDTSGLAPGGGSVRSQTVRLSSTYFDTPEHDLLRSGVTLRRRTGDTDTGWHLKIPSGDARTEVRLPLDGDVVPDEMLKLVSALTRGAEVQPVATLRTERHVHELLGKSGKSLAEIADDNVTATVGGSSAAITNWHEVEVELAEGDEDLLTRSAKWLIKSGAVPASVGSKLARALGPADPSPARDGTLTGLVGDYLHEQFRVLVQGDVELRRGGEVVHRTRVATRRFRSVLRVFGDLFDGSAARALDAELAWYAERLGAVRDVQVLREHLMHEVASVADELNPAGLAEHVSAALDVDEQQARGELLAALASDRYATLLHDARIFVTSVAARRDGKEKRIARYVRSAEKTARKRLRAASRTPIHDEKMHRARKAAKRARYTAELATPALGKSAARTAKRYKRAQTDLGTLQDAVVASHYLAGLAGGEGTVGFGIGVLWQREQQRADTARRKGRKLAHR